MLLQLHFPLILKILSQMVALTTLLKVPPYSRVVQEPQNDQLSGFGLDKLPSSLRKMFSSSEKGKARNVTASEFKTVRFESTFVDKTAFIAQFLQLPNAPFYVAAPPGFGKTVNLDMLYQYLDAPTTPEGEIARFSPDVLDTFVETEFFHEDHFLDHYQQYKVIRLDFRPLLNVTDKDSFKMSLSHIVCKMEVDYSYLSFFEIVNNDTSPEALFESCMHYYKTHFRFTLDVAEFLIADLQRKFGYTVIVLIDDYDALLHTYMKREVQDKDWIYTALGEFISSLVQDFPLKTLMVGSLTLEGVGIADNVDLYPANRDQAMARYFGFTADEVSQLFHKHGFNGKAELVRNWYGGYTVLDNSSFQLYNPLSVVDFFKTGECRPYWADRVKDLRRDFAPFFTNLQLGRCVEEFIFSRAVESVTFNFANVHVYFLTTDKLRDAVLRPKPHQSLTVEEVDLFVRFLFELGYLTYHDKPPQRPVRVLGPAFLKCPNHEARERLKTYLLEEAYYDAALGVSLAEQVAFGETLLALPTNKTVQELARVTQKIFGKARNVSISAAIQSAFRRSSKLRSKFKDIQFELNVGNFKYGRSRWDRLDAVFITNENVAVFVETVEEPPRLGRVSGDATQDRDGEVFERNYANCSIQNKAFFRIHISSQHRCHIFYHIRDASGYNSTGLAEYPAQQ